MQSLPRSLINLKRYWPRNVFAQVATGMLVLGILSSLVLPMVGIIHPWPVHANNVDSPSAQSAQSGAGKCLGNAPFVFPATGPLGWTYYQPGRGEPGFPDYHTGIDFLGTPGSPVYAVAAGKVVGVGNSPAGHPSTAITIEHQDLGIATYYTHLDPNSFKVSVGQLVTQGQYIGNIGDITVYNPPHLHFSVKKAINVDERNIANTDDPSPYFNADVRYHAGDPDQNGHSIQDLCYHALFYNSLNYQQYLTSMDPGLTDLSSRPGINDSITSIKLPPGWSIIAYQNSDRSGGVKTFYSSDPDLRDDYFVDPTTPTPTPTSISVNDNISAVQVYDAYTGCPYPYGPSRRGSASASIAGSSCSPQQQQQQTCLGKDAATFVTDVTIPDGTAVSPGQSFVKTWRIRNSGGCQWSGYNFKFVSGNQLNGPPSIAVPVKNAGDTLDISITLVAPWSGGAYTGYWQLENAQGVVVPGGPYWVTISVPYGSGPGGGSGSEDSLNANYPTVVSPGQQFRPSVTATLNSGQLLQSRGDMLRNVDGKLFGAWPFVAVTGTVNAGTSYTFTFYADHPMVAPNTEGDYSSVWQIWQDGRWVGPQYTIAFTVKNGGGTRPNAPTLNSPANWSINRDGSTPTLCVNSASNVQYDFQVVGAQTEESGWTSTTCWNPPTLGPYNFSWHAKVRDNGSGLESGWSDSWNFTVSAQVLTMEPLSFSPPSPSAEDDTVYVRSCVHGFGDINLGLSYEINSATDGSANGEWHGFSNHGNNCPDPNNIGTWGTMPSRSYADGDHLVRAYGFGPSGQTMYVEAIYHFNHRRPGGLVLITPVGSMRVNSRTVTFAWQPAVNVQTYRLVISTHADLSSPLFDQNVGAATSYTYTFSSDYSPVYWGLYAINDLGQQEATADFGIDRTAPTASVAALTTTATDSTFTVAWSGADGDAGLRWFNVQYRDGNTPGAAWVDWQTNTDATAALFTGTPGHTYYFRAQAMDNAGNLGAYPSGDGDTHTLIDLNARPKTAWWDAGYAGKRNAIILNNDTQPLPSGYPIHLHFDASTSPTASELYTASQTTNKGDDIRIIYLDQTELPRYLASFTPNQVDIWFDLQAPLGPSPTTDSTSYQIYFGNAAATNPPGTINDVIPEGTDANTLGLWHLQEGAGSTISDSSGNGHNGVATNMGWTNGKFGPAGVFLNANRAVVDLGNSTSFNTPVITLEAWVNPSTVGGEQSIFRKQADDGSLIYDFIVQGQVWLRLNGNEGNAHGNTTLQVGHWYHIVGTYDGSTIRVYLNGVLDGSASYNKPLRYGSTSHLYLGGDGQNNNKYFDGSIQDARISNVVRTSYPYAAFANVLAEPSTNVGSPVAPPQVGAPALSIQSVDTYPTSGGTTIAVVVQNDGSVDTANGFSTDLYLDHQPSGPGDYTGSIDSWVADSVGADDSVTLATVAPASPSGSSSRRQAAANDTPTETSQTFYVQADSSGSLIAYDQPSQTISGPVVVCTAEADSFEGAGDGSAAMAQPISTDGTPQAHNFDTAGDQDWVSLAATAGQTYTISTSNLGQNADTVLTLYGPDGTTIVDGNDDYNGDTASQITWQAPTSGTYYVQVTDYSPAASGCGTTYDLSVAVAQVIPTIAAGASSAVYGQKVSLSASPFASGEQVNLYWDSTLTTALVSATADSNGSINTTIDVPQAALGAHAIIAVGQTSHRTGTTHLDMRPSIALVRSGGNPSGTGKYTLTAYGFANGETIDVYWQSQSGTPLTATTANTLGSTATLSLTLPLPRPGGSKLYIVGQSSHEVVVKVISIGAPCRICG